MPYFVRAAFLLFAGLAIACGPSRRGRPPGLDSGLPPPLTDGSIATMDGGSLPPPIDGGGPSPDGGTPPRLDGGPPPVRDGGPPPVRDSGPPPPIDSGMGPTTISDIQRGLIPVDTYVRIANVVVTAIRADTIWVQDPAGGSTYSGVKVYVGGPHGALRNDRVDVEGYVTEYFGDTEIETATVTLLGRTGTITPVALTVAQATTEPYEGVLVRLTDVSSYEYPYDCTLDNPACPDFDLWRVGGASGIVVHGYAYESADWLSRVGYTRITGVMGYRFDRRRIFPRTSSDLSP